MKLEQNHVLDEFVQLNKASYNLYYIIEQNI